MIITGCFITGVVVFVVTVVLAAMVHQDTLDNTLSKYKTIRSELRKERDLWRTRCYLMNKQIRETAEMLVHTQPAPRIETQWDTYFKEGE